MFSISIRKFYSILPTIANSLSRFPSSFYIFNEQNMINSHSHVTESIPTTPKTKAIRATARHRGSSHSSKKKTRSTKRGSKKRIDSSSDDDYSECSDDDFE